MFLAVVMISILLLPVAAQMFQSPKPLDTPMSKWLAGQWQGMINGPFGEVEEWMAVTFGLENQFLLMQGKSKSSAMEYKGMGAMTVDPKTGNFVGVWIDNFRGMYKGSGKEEGNKITMEWAGPQGKSTRIIEKLSQDKMKVSVKMPGPDGKITTFSGELSRVKLPK